MVALTNGGKETLEKQMNSSGLNIYFDAAYSVESVKKFKPHPETYQHVLREENCLPKNAMLIAAHAWDIMGAKKIGMQTAFLQRQGKYLYPNAEKPTLTIKSLIELHLKLES
ncbi:HAD-IA family hydrolase [Psychroflexus sp. CAK8W]|uniref:HAD-IA family hydrolase n=1 Tax=Psychroflexus longus TaxID=2873596 RepID=A0ABS7XEL7_9FLAO|nr:HAD-IA family hydrolase [Psychroflexus longus]